MNIVKYASAAAAAGWINVEAYDTSSPNCTGLSSGYASYATGVCLLGTTGSYQYQATVTTDASKVSIVKYTFTNYTDTVCQTVNKVISLSYAEGSCVVRTPLSSGDFNFPYYYTYAVYSYTSGSIPVLPPYPGVVKT